MQFLNPWLLLGLIAVAIPIAVHLFNFRRYRKVMFSNVRYLKELKQQTRKQSNLLHLLVMAARILAIIFIVLAFAQPFLSSSKTTTKATSRVISVFVDNSFSMEAQGTNGSLMEEAKDKAREIASAYEQDDLFHLITNDFEGNHQRLVSRDEFLTMLNDIRVSSSVRSFSEIVSRQLSAFENEKQKNAIVHYVSDFQKSTILHELPDSLSGSGYLIPLKPASGNNLYIDTCWFNNPVLQLNEQTTMNVRITNASDIRLEKIPVRLMVENTQRAVASVDVDAGSSTELTFTFTNTKPGTQSGYIEIDDYPVTYDDIYYFTFNISAQIRVLCINDAEDDRYINSVFKVDSIINLSNTTLRQIDFSSLPSYKLIILNGLKSAGSGLMQELTKFVENGGSLIIVPSNDADISNVNNLLSQLGSDLITGLEESAVKVSRVNTNHPLYSEVFEQGGLKADNLDMPVITRHFTLAHSSASKSEILLQLANGNPLLSSNTYINGTVYLMTAPLNDKAGNFVRHALFVPTMLNIAFRSEKAHSLMYYNDYKNPVPIQGELLKADNVIRVSKKESDFQFIPEFRMIDGKANIFINDQINEAGIYQVSTDDRTIDMLAFNYNRKESDLKTASFDELEKIKEATGLNLIEISPKPLNNVINEHNQDNKIWKWLIIAAILSLITEVLLLVFFKKSKVVV